MPAATDCAIIPVPYARRKYPGISLTRPINRLAYFPGSYTAATSQVSSRWKALASNRPAAASSRRAGLDRWNERARRRADGFGQLDSRVEGHPLVGVADQLPPGLVCA